LIEDLSEDDTPAPLPLRIALISIAGFWSLYFVILTIRAIGIYHVHVGMDARAIVSVASMGVTVILYWLVRLVPIRRLGLAITVAALLAAPAAVAYAVINYTVFDRLHIGMGKKDEKKQGPAVTIVTPGQPSQTMTSGTGGTSGNSAWPAPSPAPAPTAPTMITVGTMPGSDEMSNPLMDVFDQAANGYFFFASWAALYLALCYAGEVGRLARRASELEAAAQSAELRALRYQVNPHFLFNTLNSLSSLVMTGKRDEAERMIINLAAFFRTSLTGDPTEDVRLSEEIALQRLYLDIEAIRFPDRLQVEIAVPEALESACVPGLILQPLIENAVKHGVSRARRPVTIAIQATEESGDLVLRVTDDGDGALGRDPNGTGLGLANVRDRLQARYGARGSCKWAPLAEGGFAVKLSMPLVRHGC